MSCGNTGKGYCCSHYIRTPITRSCWKHPEDLHEPATCEIRQPPDLQSYHVRLTGETGGQCEGGGGLSCCEGACDVVES